MPINPRASTNAEWGWRRMHLSSCNVARDPSYRCWSISFSSTHISESICHRKGPCFKITGFQHFLSLCRTSWGSARSLTMTFHIAIKGTLGVFGLQSSIPPLICTESTSYTSCRRINLITAQGVPWWATTIGCLNPIRPHIRLPCLLALALIAYSRLPTPDCKFLPRNSYGLRLKTPRPILGYSWKYTSERIIELCSVKSMSTDRATIPCLHQHTCTTPDISWNKDKDDW